MYGTITIPNGSELIFNDEEINMTITNIKVSLGMLMMPVYQLWKQVDGHLWMGSETCRLGSGCSNIITITFDDSATAIPGIFLSVCKLFVCSDVVVIVQVSFLFFRFLTISSSKRWAVRSQRYSCKHQRST